MSVSLLSVLLLVFAIANAKAFRGFTSLFTKVDRNRDGGLSSQELIAVGDRFGIQSSVILEALRMTDSDGNRVLNPSEFEQLQDSIDGTGQIRGRSSGSRSSGSAVSRLHRSRTAANVDVSTSNTAPPLVEQLLQAFDGDRNGKLSQREVQQMFTQHGMPFSVADDAFRASDNNGDWELDASEMVNFYHRAQASVSNYASSQRFGQQKQQAIEQRRFQQVQQGQPQRKPFQSRNQPLN